MQAEEQHSRATLTIHPDIRDRVCSLKRGNDTYNDVLKTMPDTIEIGEEGDCHGIIFLHSVLVKGDLKKLKKPITLRMHIEDNGTIHLANTEFKLLVLCDNLNEAIKEAQYEYSDLFDIYNNSETKMSKDAEKFGKKLKDSVWM
jgi:hypothetical protein